jgi:hypothetical protein
MLCVGGMLVEHKGGGAVHHWWVGGYQPAQNP